MGILIGIGIIGLVILLVRFFEQRRITLMKASGVALGLVPLAKDEGWPFGAALAEWMGKNRGRSAWLSSGWSYEGHGRSLYVYRPGTTAKPKKPGLWLDEAAAEAQGFTLMCGRSRG